MTQFPTAILAVFVSAVLADADLQAVSPQSATTLPSTEGGLPRSLIGYSQFRTNIPGGRHPNCVTMRAHVVRPDGAGRRMLAEGLVTRTNTWTQFAGWSPDGRIAILLGLWESPENAAWEEEHKTFRMTQGWLCDTYFLEMATGKLTNITAVERVSDYNTGVFFWPKDPHKLGFTALIGGISHPFSMDRDGRNKKDLSAGKEGFAYGYSASPDGKLISYHKDYQVYIARADGADPKHVKTGNPFNFCPTWSPDGQWLLFVSGEHYNCHPYVVRLDGTGLRKVGDRGGYEGVVTIYDVCDFHGGSSDVPVWSRDGRWIYHTAKVGKSVEMMRCTPDGRVEQLTHSPDGTFNYHPTPSPDGKWLIIGSTRTGTRQLYLMRPDGKDMRPITDVKPGWAAMFPHWQPQPKNP
ncbi:MAG: PD40 domain-containing protein [Phycisphaerae bacterium]|nr:PD40 domain-containing protein [Phycisphaerae bacterium]